MVAVKPHAQLGKRALDERRLHYDSRETDIPGRLQINLVKGCRKVIGAIAGTKLSEGLGISDRKLLVCAEALHRSANLLHLGHPQRRRTDLAYHACHTIFLGAATDPF